MDSYFENIPLKDLFVVKITSPKINDKVILANLQKEDNNNYVWIDSIYGNKYYSEYSFFDNSDKTYGSKLFSILNAPISKEFKTKIMKNGYIEISDAFALTNILNNNLKNADENIIDINKLYEYLNKYFYHEEDKGIKAKIKF